MDLLHQIIVRLCKIEKKISLREHMIYLFHFRPTSVGSVYEKISLRKYGDNKVWMAGPHQLGNHESERKKILESICM